MRDNDALLGVLAKSADPAVVACIRTMLHEGSDEDLARINVVDFALSHSVDEDAAIDAFVRSTRIGLFDMSWNVLCPGCGGVVAANPSLNNVGSDHYFCALCSRQCEAILDDAVEVRFVASPRARSIGAHDPARLPFWDYHRQMFLGSGTSFPVARRFDELACRAVVGQAELRGGENHVVDFFADRGAFVVFDPVTHTSQDVKVEGEAATGSQDVMIAFDGSPGSSSPMQIRPGPVRLTIWNGTEMRLLPGIFVLGDALNELFGDRRPFLTAKRLLCNQTFRDLYQTDTVRRDQRLRIANITILFTDLKESTHLYGQVGDIAAYDLVQRHFAMLAAIVASEGGAVVKTIGDAVMAAFPSPERGVSAALRMRASMSAMNEDHATSLALKIGLHVGPCLAVNLNDRQDFFGQTVNIASRIQAQAVDNAILMSDDVLRQGNVAAILRSHSATIDARSVFLRGVAESILMIVVS